MTPRAELARLRVALQQARDDLHQLQIERAEGALALERAQAQLVEAALARDEFDRERRALARQVSCQREPVLPAPRPLDLRRVLGQRGVLAHEQADALASLLLESPSLTLDALEASGREALAGLIEDRLVLLCGRARCRGSAAGLVVHPVSPDRCEVCGGSDTAVAFHRFVTACQARALSRVVIVGGSPNYRRQLRALAAAGKAAGEASVRLELIDGTTRPQARRVKSMARTSDMVVIWCATMVDHATTNAFEASGVPTVQVPVRGIGRMLGWLARYLEDRPPQ